MKAINENLRKKITIVLFFLMGVFVSATAFAAPDAAMIIANPGENSATEMRISWHTNVSVTGSFVEYTKKSDTSWANSKKVVGDCALCKTWYGITSQTVQVNKCGAVLSNLEPNTDYMYRVGLNELSDIRYFKTAGAKEYTFAWISDIHHWQSSVSRLNYAMSMSEKLISLAGGPDKINFFLSTGDEMSYGGVYSSWQDLYSRDPVKNYLWVSMVGNHDYDTSDTSTATATSAYFRDVHNNPPNGYAGDTGVSYWFKYGDVLWVVLNSLNRTNMTAWLENVLKNNPAQYIIVAQHYDWFSGINGTVGMGWYSTLYPILDKYGVDLAIAGNNHIYVRTKSLYNNAVNTDPTRGTYYIQAPSSDNARGRATETFTANADKIVTRWTEGAATVGGLLVSVNGEKLKIDLYDRNGVRQDNVEIPAKRLPPYQLPPYVTGVSPDKLNAVNIKNPITLNFSSNMDKTSVEESIDFLPAAVVGYTWRNNNVLEIDISQLNYETDYTLTIDGNVAKSESGKFLDGTGSGTEKSNYVLNFTTCVQDLTPPAVVSYDPQGVQEESLRPIVRIEFDEFLNELTFGNAPITVTDKNGNTVGGVFSYNTTANFKSVMHYVFNEDLKSQKTYTVTLAEGIEDVYGNAMTNQFTFDFTARPRQTTLVHALANFNGSLDANWWDATGSGSTVGVVAAGVTGDSKVKPTAESAGSVRLDYQWSSTHASPLIRWHYNETTPRFSKNNTIQYYLFGDGSNTRVTFALRDEKAGSFFAHQYQVLNWVGWKQITWDIANESFIRPIVSGTNDIPDPINMSCFVILPATTDCSYEQSSIYFSRLRLVKLGDVLPPYTSVPSVKTEGIDVVAANNAIKVTAAEAISDIRVYSITGALGKSAQPVQASYEIPTCDLAKGVYVVKVATGTSQRNVKVVVK